jgi:hypothetical protein
VEAACRRIQSQAALSPEPDLRASSAGDRQRRTALSPAAVPARAGKVRSQSGCTVCGIPGRFAGRRPIKIGTDHSIG